MQSFNLLSDSPKAIQSLFDISEKNLTHSPETLEPLLESLESIESYLRLPVSKRTKKLANKVMEEFCKHETHEVIQLAIWLSKNSTFENDQKIKGAYASLHLLFEAIHELPEHPKVPEHILNLYKSRNNLHEIDSKALYHLEQKYKIPMQSNVLSKVPLKSKRSPATWDSLPKNIKEIIYVNLNKKSLFNLSLSSKANLEKIRSEIPNLLNKGKTSLKTLNMDIIELKDFIGIENCSKIRNLNVNFAKMGFLISYIDFFPNLENLTIDLSDSSSPNKCFCFHDLLRIKKINILNCGYLEQLSIVNCKKLKEIKVENCKQFSTLHFNNRKNLVNFDISQLVENIKIDFSKLMIDKFNITDFNFLKNISKITKLSLFSGNIENFDELKNHNNIKCLEIKNSTFKDLNFIKNCPWMTSLILEDCNIEDLDTINSLKNCENINQCRNILNLPHLELLKITDKDSKKEFGPF